MFVPYDIKVLNHLALNIWRHVCNGRRNYEDSKRKTLCYAV
jgi:hypothetical protein